MLVGPCRSARQRFVLPGCALRPYPTPTSVASQTVAPFPKQDCQDCTEHATAHSPRPYIWTGGRITRLTSMTWNNVYTMRSCVHHSSLMEFTKPSPLRFHCLYRWFLRMCVQVMDAVTTVILTGLHADIQLSPHERLPQSFYDWLSPWVHCLRFADECKRRCKWCKTHIQYSPLALLSQS